jgi:uncharacterized protein (TIGR00251 family)
VIKSTPRGVEIDIRVIPRARASRIDGERDGRLLVRLAAPPVEGAANDALIEFLAALLDIPKRSVRLVAGERSRQKRIAIDGVNAETLRQRLVRGEK